MPDLKQKTMVTLMYSSGLRIREVCRLRHEDVDRKNMRLSNSRILDLDHEIVTFSARGKKPGDPKRQITLTHTEFIRCYLMHVLPAGFQKIRYYGFLNNRMKTRNLKVICKLQGGLRFKQRYAGMSMAELLKAVWNFDICVCPECGHATMKQLGRCHVPSS